MIHIVNPQTSEILDYITLDNIIDDTHKKSLESYIETYDAIVLGGNDFSYDKHLEKRNHIIIPDEDGTYQEFILFEVDKYRDTEGRKTHFYAHATYLELKKAKVIYPTRREGLTASQHAGWALNDTGWTVGIVEAEGTRTFTIEKHTNPYEFLKRIANEFEVELRFRIEHDGNRITGRYVDLLERIGEWRGREIEFGKDLDGIRRIEKQDIVTALLGLGPEREDGTRIEVLVEDEEALQRWGRVDEHGNLHHLIEPYEIQSDRQEMTEEEARQYTRTALDKRINTQVTYETTILDLEEVPGLEHEKIRFGDTIRIKDTYFNPPLYLEARVFEIERSIKNKAKKDIKLGDYIEYTEEEVNAIWNQLRNEIGRRLDRMAIVSINSSAGNIFKNAQGETELTARTFVNGTERDEDGTLYDYQWMRFDKDGNHDTSFYAEGKTITVTANDIDEKATYRVLVAYELEVINTAEITISNVFDGEPGPPGPKGDKGDPGPQGPPGTSVTSIVEYYLATDQNSGVTIDTPGWTTTMQQMTPTNRYLWNYERINFSDGTYQNTNPVIIGIYGDEGEEGRSIVSITEYYLASSASSGVTRNTPGWTTTMQVTTPEKKYLWNYEKITWNKAPLETYTEPVIIGVHGERGPQGPQGPQGIQGPPGQDGQSQYVHIRYSANSNGNPMTSTPQSDTKYIGLAVTTSPTAPSSYTAYTWSKYRGEDGQDGIPGPPGKDGQTTYTWVKYADDENGNGMSDSPDGKLYIGLAFNKTTPTESNNPADYTWSLMPQNIEYSARNLFRPNNTAKSRESSSDIKVSPTSFYVTGGWDNYSERILIDEGEEFTVSFWAKLKSGTATGVVVHPIMYDSPTSSDRTGTYNQTVQVNSSDWVYYERTWVTFPNTKSMNIYFRPDPSSTGDVWINGLMVTRGNKAPSDWSPALEDVQEQIDEAKQEAERAKQEAQQAQTTADGKNTVFRQSSQPPTSGRKIGDVWFDTSRDNLMHVFNGTQWVEAKWGEQSIVANSITANHIKSLIGLNVNNQFIVDSNGNVKFSGHLEGATGVFSGEIKTKKLRVRADSVHDFYDFGIEIETAQWQPDLDNPFVRTGYISFNTGNDALEIYRIDNDGVYRPLQGFSVEAERVLFTGKMQLIPDQTGNYGDVLKLSGGSSDHVYIEFYRSSPFERSAYIGIPSRNSEHFVINAHGITGELRLAGANVYVAERLINPAAYQTTTSSAANGYVASNGYFARSTSSKRYKQDIRYCDVDYKKILNLKQASWYDKGEVERNEGTTEGLRRYYGAIAEDFEKIGLSEYVIYNEETGEVENFSDRAWVLLIPNINDILEELEQIKERLERLENERN